jgi:hypothetical protein
VSEITEAAIVLRYVDSDFETKAVGAMVTKCANSWCFATRCDEAGKLFRLDIDICSKAGGNERKTEYMWLCPRCAQEMHPEVEVTGNTLRVRLSRNDPMPLADSAASPERVN